MLEFLAQWWPYLVSVLVIGGFLIFEIKFRPEKVKQWLIYACASAEAALGNGTGKLKLRSVYDMFISRYPILSFFISFDKFQEWTEEALSEFKGMLEDNPALADLFTDGVVIEKTEEEKTEN